MRAFELVAERAFFAGNRRHATEIQESSGEVHLVFESVEK